MSDAEGAPGAEPRRNLGAAPGSSGAAPGSSGAAPGAAGGVRAAALVCLVLGLVWAAGVSMADSWGWDEAMHAELPAARMALHLREGQIGGAAATLLDCQQYPFGWPLVLAAVQVVTGPSEFAARFAGRLFWALGGFGLFLLVREVVRGARGAALAPWLALALFALSPLFQAYSGTLFLEVPSAVVAIFALYAWTRRGSSTGLRGELWAGALLTAAFFTKFNYGLLLGFGCALDLCCEAALELRAGRARALLRRTATLALVPALGALWWFAIPLPEGFARAAAHREAFAGFLAGNRDASMTTSGAVRILHWAAQLVWTPRVLLLVAIGLLASLRELRRPGVRLLWLVALGGGLPVWLHNFQLDRFLIPGAVPLFALAGVGLALLVPTRPVARGVTVFVLVLAVGLAPGLDRERLFDATYGFAEAEATRAYQLEVLADWSALGPGRPLPTAGMARGEHDALSDLLAADVGPRERVGWLGISSRYSPAALQLALLARGAAPARILGERLERTYVTHELADPGWTTEQLMAWAEGFDVIVTTEPIDLGRHPARAFMNRYRSMLFEQGSWTYALVGSFEIQPPLGDAYAVEVFACRPR